MCSLKLLRQNNTQLEQYYKEHKETKMKDLLDKLHLEEQEAVARLTHKHAQEMLFMIERKVMTLCVCVCCGRDVM